MLRPLLLLFAVIAVPGAAGQYFTTSTQFDISSCPITYYQQTYEEVYATFTSENFVVCFDGYYDPQAGGDCLLAPPADEAYFGIVGQDNVVEQLFLQNLPTINSYMRCYIWFSLPNGVAFAAVNFGSQAALGLRSFSASSAVLDVLLHGNKINELSVSITPANTQPFDYLDVSGCRLEGVAYKPGTLVSSDPTTCMNISCSQTADLQTFTCGPTETCDGNGRCVTPIHSICTVTGPSVIDFDNNLNFVEDLCEYYLLQIEGLSVVGRFRERRRRDVSFLDSLCLTVNDVNIHLEQGGRVVVDHTPLDLSSPQVVDDDVVVSEDHTGVTVVVQIQDLEITVFFDGYTAHILVDGSTGSPLEGLCQNSSSEARLPDCRSSSCVPHYNYTDDNMICPNNTKSCYYLNEKPFTSCDINVEPYLDACTDLLSRYPAVDGLKCQFLTAYAKACSLYSNITVHDWRSKSECHHHGAFCQNKTCNHHEFCAESYSGDNLCFCRANFACEIRNNYAYGHPPVCKKHHASLTLYICLLEEKNIDYTILHLNDPTCRGELDEEDNTVTFTFEGDTCGTEIIDNGTHIIYENTVTNQNITDVITRQDVVMIDFSCYQTQPDLLTKTFTVMKSDYEGVIVSGHWSYTLFMKAYIDDDCTKLVDSNTPIKLNQQVWVKLITKGLDEDVLVLVTDHCWATDQPSPSAANSYDLIVDGCPADPTVVIRGNGKGTFNKFAFNMFEFTSGSNQIYLHCEVSLCVKSTNMCEPNCPGKQRRRFVRSEPDSIGLISMGWSS